MCLFIASGEFSRFFVQSVTSDGHMRKTGGDSWRVYIRQGPASLAPTVFDNDDGTYEVMFLVLEPGNYSVQVFLDYTLCDGFRDPPEDWFIRGLATTFFDKFFFLISLSCDFDSTWLRAPKPKQSHHPIRVRFIKAVNGFVITIHEDNGIALGPAINEGPVRWNPREMFSSLNPRIHIEVITIQPRD